MLQEEKVKYGIIIKNTAFMCNWTVLPQPGPKTNTIVYLNCPALRNSDYWWIHRLGDMTEL